MDYQVFSTCADRFMRYVKIDTQADPYSSSSPSTEKQLDLSRLLLNELLAAGIGAEITAQGYVYAHLEATVENPGPGIFFCAHVDTAPDCSGTNVKPILHTNYSGNEFMLPDDKSIIISPVEFPELTGKLGEDIITASGLTLLGADDKAGVTAIMEAALFMNSHPEIGRPAVDILFTTDEEIGRGVNHFNPNLMKSKYGYTLDGGELGSIEDETFSADGCSIRITGVATHPGYAKEKMQNAIKIVSHIISSLPTTKDSPESTEGRSGFIHPTKIESSLETGTIDLIIRDFNTQNLKYYHELLQGICESSVKAFPGSSFEIEFKEQYRNMNEIIQNHPYVCSYAIEAMQNLGIEPKKSLIRGGTDGSRLSFMGFPCPNLFAGEHGIHSKKEWVSVQDMQKAAAVIVKTSELWSKHRS